MILVGGLLHLLLLLVPLGGLGVLGAIVRDPATLMFLAAASALYAGDAVTMRWPSVPTPSPLNARAKRWAAVSGVLLLLLFWSCLVERALDTPIASDGQIAGFLLMIGGIGLRAAAVHTLGSDFLTEIDVPDAGSLVRHGVYRFLRHPSETGLLAATLGSVWLLQSRWGIVVWLLALVPVTLVRLSLEEHALTRRFGEDYQRYIREVGALFPIAVTLHPG